MAAEERGGQGLQGDALGAVDNGGGQIVVAKIGDEGSEVPAQRHGRVLSDSIREMASSEEASMAAAGRSGKTLEERVRLIEDRFAIYDLIARHPPSADTGAGEFV